MDETNSKLLLPISKIKKICRLDPDTGPISFQAAHLITLATEKFIKLLAKAAYDQAALHKRKTLQAKDVESCIRMVEVFDFLTGTLDGWPEWSTAKRVTADAEPTKHSNDDFLKDTVKEETETALKFSNNIKEVADSEDLFSGPFPTL